MKVRLKGLRVMKGIKLRLVTVLPLLILLLLAKNVFNLSSTTFSFCMLIIFVVSWIVEIVVFEKEK